MNCDYKNYNCSQSRSGLASENNGISQTGVFAAYTLGACTCSCTQSTNNRYLLQIKDSVFFSVHDHRWLGYCGKFGYALLLHSEVSVCGCCHQCGHQTKPKRPLVFF